MRMNTIYMAFVILATILMTLLFLGCAKKKPEPETKAAAKCDTAASTQIATGYSYTITNLRNNVSWSTDDSSWQQAGKGLTLPAGAYVETGIRSMVLFTGSLGDMIVVGERSKVRLSIDDLSRYASTGAGAVRGLRLLKGLATFDIRKSIGWFFVETPTATVKVKGTNFSVAYNEKSQRTNVKVIQGTVAVIDKKHPESLELVLTGKEKAEEIGSATPSVKKPISENDVREFITPATIESIKVDIWPSVSFPTPEAARETGARLATEGMDLSKLASLKSAEKAIDSAKSNARSAMDSVRNGYTKQVEKEKASYEKAATDSRKTVTDEKNKAAAGLDSARQAYEKEKASGQRPSGSGAMFDDMKRRRNAGP